MLLKKFYVNIVFRVAGILASCIAIALCWVWKPDWLILINLLLILAIQVVLLLVKMNQLNKDLESFFTAIRSNDSSIIFTGKNRYSPFKSLYLQLETINKDIQNLKIENHRQNEYFKVLVEHVNIGLISFDKDERVTLYNRTAREIIGKHRLQKIEELEQIQSGLSTIVKELEPSQQKLITIYSNGGIQQLSLRSAWIKYHENWIKLVSFQNIRNELDEKELESWQKLIRVLTHELMNSAGPINSTISTIKEFLTNPDGEPKPAESLTDHIVDDTVEGLKIIEERSQGMMDFVKKFRSLTLLPKPVITSIVLNDLFNSIDRLLAEQFKSQNIAVEVKISPSTLSLMADKGMMEQILLNLISNSINALNNTTSKRIVLSATKNENQQVVIQVTDNGCGIPPEIQDKVFIPFFTTRKEGSGIGLSFSRQLIRLQGGTLTFTSIQDAGSIFTIII